MVKKTLLSLAIAATAAGLAGCNVSSTDKYENDIDNTPVLSGQPGFTVDTVTPQFQPTRSADFGGALVPLATDIVFAINSQLEDGEPGKDGTANTADTTPPVTTAVNKLAGFSTTAPFYVNFTGALDPESVEAGKSVFLIKLKNAEDNASIDALDIRTILAAGNPLAANQPEAGVDYEARYLTLDNGNTHTVQIIPKKPLSSKTKYIVAFSNGIKSASGKPAMASGDTLLIRSDQVVPEALQGLRTQMRVWDGIARTATGLTADSLVLSYSFTTDGSLDALKQYAAPSLFVANNLPLATAESLIEASSPGATTTIAQGVVLAGGGDPLDSDQVAAAKLTDAYASAIYSQIAGATLSGAPASLNALVDRPAPRTVAMVDGAAVDGVIGTPLGASPAQFQTGTSTTTRYYQGKIELPNFLDQVTLTTELTATGISAAMKADADWSANTTVGAVLDAALGNDPGTTPPKDVDGSTNVTYRYPFPQASTEASGVNVAPMLVTMPESSACGGATEVPVVIYVHGITGSRANSVAYAAALANACIATVAIDLPLHGVAPLTADANGAAINNSAKPFNMEYTKAALTGSPWGGVIAAQVGGGNSTFASVAERHGNIYQDSNSIRRTMDFDGTVDTDGADGDVAAGTSGSAFINLQNFTRSRDNLRQAVVDLLNLNASLAGISNIVDDFPTGTGFDLDKVFVAGHSLGAIVATTFVAVNNDASVLAANTDLNKVQGVILANGGAHISKLLENSPTFGPTIVNGLAAVGVNQGTENFEKFMYVIQSTIDVVDPANSGLKLAETDTPVVLFNMVGGNALPSDETALAKISYPTAFKALGVYLPDHTVPNFDYFANGDTNPYAAFAPALGLSAEVSTAKAPIAGTDGLAAIMGLETVNANTDTSTLGSPTRVVTRFSEGTHSTFANADTTAAFTEMVVESVTLINGAFSTANPAVLESSN